MALLPLVGITYVYIATVGYLVNKYTRLPWMFSTVLFGMALSALGLFQGAFGSPAFSSLARLGMLMFLLMIGLDLDLDEIRKLGSYIVGGDILLVFVEGSVLALFFYFVLPEMVNHSFVVAMAAGVAFGTVGEVVLAAILKEFNLLNTRFGQLAMGIGIFDDVFEILVMAFVIALPAFYGIGETSTAWASAGTILLTLAGLLALTVALSLLGKRIRPLFKRLPPGPAVVPFIILAVAFGFIAFGSLRYEDMGVVAAVLAGITLKQILPEPALEQHKKPLNFVATIFLGPIFFLSLGAKMSVQALVSYPLVILAVVVIALGVRIGLSYLLFNRLLGRKASVIMGIGLTSKFSTSVVTENLLFTSGMITAPLYSVLMGAFIILKPLIVGGFSRGAAVLADELKAEAPSQQVKPGAVEPTPQPVNES